MKRSLPGTPARGDATTKLSGRLGAVALTCTLLTMTIVGCAGSLDPGVTGSGSGGSGGTSGGGTGGGSGTGCEVALLTNKCVPCHATVGNSAGLDLQSANIGARLVGVPSFSGAGAICAGKTLLDKGSNPATGFFIEKITQATPSCGLVMPFGQMMADSDIACLTTWATTLTGSP